MIYKFIDNNGSEISVNSLESLQALVYSNTVNESTKVKAGLRGKWIKASEIEELNFTIEEKVENSSELEVDIKSFITKDENLPKEAEVISKIKEEEKIYQEKKVVAQDVIEEKNDESTVDDSDYYTEKFDKSENIKTDNNSSGVTLKNSWKICLSKLTDFSGRACRSEFWKFYLSFVFLYFSIFFGILVLIILDNPTISDGALDAMSWLFGVPAGLITLSATVRRLHDTNKSGWFVLLSLIPILGLIILIMLILPGDKGKNKFGDNPLKE